VRSEPDDLDRADLAAGWGLAGVELEYVPEAAAATTGAAGPEPGSGS
jgi:hypothetical protein